jgi:hypothetical protein
MLTHRATGRFKAAGTVAISLGLMLLLVAPADAATPTLTASLTPDSAKAGAQTPFTLSVSSDQGTLQSLTLDAPSGFFVDVSTIQLSANGNASSSTSSQIVIGGLKISGSTVLTVSFDAYPACTPSQPQPSPPQYTWTLNGIQKGSTPYAEQTFSTTVTSSTSCKLLFAPIADQIKNVPFTVVVAAARANNTTDTTYANSISLSIETDPGIDDAALIDASQPVSVPPTEAPNLGTATFSVLLDKSGSGYVLEACSPPITATPCGVLEDGKGFLSPPRIPETEASFSVYDSQTPCGNNGTCSASASVAQQVSTTVSANGQEGTSVKAGVFRVLPVVGSGFFNFSDLDCPGYDEITEVISSFEFDGSGIKTVVDVISAEQMKEIANQGVSFLQGCFGSSIRFKDRSGQWAPLDPTLGLYVGLLPDCATNKKNVVAPCVLSRQGGGNGTGLFTYVAADGDPGGKRS